MDGLKDEIRAYLTHQQRHLLLVEPIARLSLERRVIFRDDPAIAELDVRYLALSAMDFVMERSAIESGAPPAGIVDHVAGEATRIMPTLTEEQSRKAGQVILDYLANARDGHKAFRARSTTTWNEAASRSATSGCSSSPAPPTGRSGSSWATAPKS